ncbi:hypothetical protein KFE25_009752 [Diacronema lutheri]|uniref:Calponin-homology (CH) domain-containing protein n=1 Tax=Diacronema lutheri TaxID=2081491 RepID=A0A8J6BZF2_DIALT|nr:hypothetical protein KFE25_009752 [Diacronema lutheri]
MRFRAWEPRSADAERALTLIREVTGVPIYGHSDHQLLGAIRSGVLLCQYATALCPGGPAEWPKLGGATSTVLALDNLAKFVEVACIANVPTELLITPADLHDGLNARRVRLCLKALRAAATTGLPVNVKPLASFRAYMPPFIGATYSTTDQGARGSNDPPHSALGVSDGVGARVGGGSANVHSSAASQVGTAIAAACRGPLGAAPAVDSPTSRVEARARGGATQRDWGEEGEDAAVTQEATAVTIVEQAVWRRATQVEREAGAARTLASGAAAAATSDRGVNPQQLQLHGPPHGGSPEEQQQPRLDEQPQDPLPPELELPQRVALPDAMADVPESARCVRRDSPAADGGAYAAVVVGEAGATLSRRADAPAQRSARGGAGEARATSQPQPQPQVRDGRLLPRQIHSPQQHAVPPGATADGGSSRARAERHALPLAAEDAARRLVEGKCCAAVGAVADVERCARMEMGAEALRGAGWLEADTAGAQSAEAERRERQCAQAHARSQAALAVPADGGVASRAEPNRPTRRAGLYLAWLMPCASRPPADNTAAEQLAERSARALSFAAVSDATRTAKADAAATAKKAKKAKKAKAAMAASQAKAQAEARAQAKALACKEADARARAADASARAKVDARVRARAQVEADAPAAEQARVEWQVARITAAAVQPTTPARRDARLAKPAAAAAGTGARSRVSSTCESGYDSDAELEALLLGILSDRAQCEQGREGMRADDASDGLRTAPPASWSADGSESPIVQHLYRA